MWPGLAYYVDGLGKGTFTLADIALTIAVGATGTDVDAFNAKVAAANLFTAAVDTTSEIVAYSGNAAAAKARAELATVKDADTLAAFNADTSVNNVVTAGANAAGQTFTLTGGIDTIVGGAGNDTIKSPNDGVGLTALDNIDGGAGNDTLNVISTAAISVSATTKVANVEAASLISAGAVSGDVSGWTGLTSLTVSEIGGANVKAANTTSVTLADSGQAGNSITVNGGTSVSVTSTGATGGSIYVGQTTAATGDVTVSRTTTSAGSAGDINVRGGKTISITQAAANAVNTTQTNGTVSVAGDASTTSVSVTASKAATASSTVAGVNANSVSISDVNAGDTTKAGTITSVSVDGYTTLGIADTALTTLSVAHGSGNIIIDNSGLTTPTNKTLALTANGLTGGTLDDADIYTTLNVTTTGADSTLANITTGAVTAVTVAGSKTLTLTSSAGLTALKTVTVSGSAGIKADLSAATVTAVDTSASTGTSTVTIDGSKATFTGGAGVDKVTTTAATVGKAISLGAGDDTLVLGSAAAPTAAISGGAGTDTLSLSAALAATASASATFAGLVTGFEQLTLTGATNQTIDLAVLGNYNYVSTAGGNGLTLSNLSSGGTLVLTGAGTAYTIGNSAFAAGTDDTINLKLTDGSGAAVAFAATGITASGVENFVITTADTQATPSGTFNDSVTLLGNSAKSITVSGNAGLTLTATDTALTSVDASGITLGGFSFTTGALAAAATIKGSATGANTVVASAATAAVTYTGGTGADTVTISNAKNNVVSVGDGANSVVLGSGNNTVTGGKDADTVVATSGNNTVSLGNGANSFTATSGDNTYTGGTGVDTVTVGGGKNVITLGTGADVVNFSAAGANVNSYSTIADAHSGVTISLIDHGTETSSLTKVTLANTAVFQDYANAVVQAGGNASTNGYVGWFQFNGDTYVVESLHDGSGVNASFANGTDVIVKLAGLVDLSTATVTGNSIVLA